MSDQTLGEYIKAKRKAMGLTQHQLADKCGLAHVSIARFETDSHYPNLDSLILLAEALDVPMDELVKIKHG